MVLGMALAAAPKGPQGGSIRLYIGKQKVVAPGRNLQRVAVDAMLPTLSRIGGGTPDAGVRPDGG